MENRREPNLGEAQRRRSVTNRSAATLNHRERSRRHVTALLKVNCYSSSAYPASELETGADSRDKRQSNALDPAQIID
jgi:hypothetical protein